MYDYTYPQQCPFTRSQCSETCALCVSSHPATCALVRISDSLTCPDHIDYHLRAITEKLDELHERSGSGYGPDSY